MGEAISLKQLSKGLLGLDPRVRWIPTGLDGFKPDGFPANRDFSKIYLLKGQPAQSQRSVPGILLFKVQPQWTTDEYTERVHLTKVLRGAQRKKETFISPQ